MERVDYLRAEEVAALLEVADAEGARDSLMVRIPLYTGARIGEVSPLAVGDCEPALGRLKLSKVCFVPSELFTLSKGKPVYDPTKPIALLLENEDSYTGDRVRFAPKPFTYRKGMKFTPKLLGEIWADAARYFETHDLRHECVKEGLKSSQPTRAVPFVDGRSRQLLADWIRDHDSRHFVFPSQKGGRLQKQQIQRKVTDLMLRAKIPEEKCYPHMLRHTFAVHFLKKNPQAVVQLSRILGHTSIKTTAIYLRFVVEDLQQLLTQSGDLFSMS